MNMNKTDYSNKEKERNNSQTQTHFHDQPFGRETCLGELQ